MTSPPFVMWLSGAGFIRLLFLTPAIAHVDPTRRCGRCRLNCSERSPITIVTCVVFFFPAADGGP